MYKMVTKCHHTKSREPSYRKVLLHDRQTNRNIGNIYRLNLETCNTNSYHQYIKWFGFQSVHEQATDRLTWE